MRPTVQVAAYRAGATLASALPAALARRMAEGIGRTAAHLPTARLHRRRAMVARHLRRVTGHDAGPDVDAAFASYARYWAESLRLPGLSLAALEAGMASEGMDEIHRARDEGNGVILALPHLGGWEWAGMWLARSGVPVSVVVEALEPPEVFEWFAAFRRRLGMEVIAAGPGAGTACLRALRANRVLCLLCDRVVGATPAVDVELFGERTGLPAGPVTLALRTGAPLVPTAAYFADVTDGHLVVVRPRLELMRAGRLRDDVARGTQLLAGELEALVRRAPTQWHLMQPNWPSDGPG